MSSQLHRNEHENRGDFSQHENRGDLSQPDDAIPSSQTPSEINHHPNNLGPGTDVIGEPVNPIHDPPPTTATSAATSETQPPAYSSAATSETHPPAYSPSVDTHAPAISPISEPRAPPSYETHATAGSGNFPTAQPPQSFSKPAYQSEASQPPYQPEASQPSTAQGASSDPYVRTTSVPGGSGKTPMDSIMLVFNKWSKKAEDMTGNVWNHLRTGPNIADTAFGRITMGAKAMTGGGLENVYRQTFDVAPEEHLLKTYACYLSTSTGPVAGTLYISSHKLAFCSDRPLAIPVSPPLAGGPANNTGPDSNTTPPHGSGASKTSSKNAALAGDNNTGPDNNTTPPHGSGATKTSSKNAASTQQQCYYKVMVPISQVEAVNPSENTQKKPPEKYVQVKTEDGHEFWFMGFVHYDKGVKNLQESLLSKPNSPNTNAATHVEGPTSPNANAATHVVN